MSNEFVIKNGFHSRGNSEITGSLTVTGGITGSIAGTSTSASYAVTASYAQYAVSASYEINYETSSSYAETASYVPTGVGGLYSGNGTIPLNTTASVNGDLLFQGLDEDTRLILKDGNGGAAIHLFSDGPVGQSALEFRTGTTDLLIHKIQNAGGDTRYVSNNRDLVFTTNDSDNTEGIFIQSGTGNLGIGTTTPTDRLFVSGSTGEFRARVDRVLPYTTELYAKTTNPSGSSVIQLVNDSSKSIVMGVLGSNRDASVAYGGESDDAFMFASSNANNLHIFNGAGTGTEDSINFYAGNNATATPHLHIHGSGSTKGYIGIGTETPSEILEVVQGTSKFVTDLNSSNGPLVNVTTTNTNSLISFAAGDGTSIMTIGTVGTGWAGSTGFGQPGDSYVYSNSSANGLNIISANGTGTEDYIRLYAGGIPTTATASIHIQGDGSTTGYVGIGTETPVDILQVVQNTEKFSLDLDNSIGPSSILSTTRTDLVSRFVTSNGVVATTMNSIGFDWTGSTVYGDPGDSSIYSNTSANGISIISAPGTGTDDYIRFYAGGNPQTSAATIHIQGSGSNKGYVGIGTETPTSKLEVVGSFNLREYGTITAPTSSADWYRIGYTTGGDRGGIRVIISYSGGFWTPQTYVINAFKNWTDVGTLQLEKYGSGAYIREARIVEDEIDSTTYHLEVYLPSYVGDGVNGHNARIYFDKNLGYEGSWNLNTGSLSASTSVANPVARSPFPLTVDGHTFPMLLINDNINNNFWKLEDGDGTLNFTDWDSDNLIQLDGVNNQVNISHSLQVLGGITGSLLGTASFADNVLFEPGQLGTNSTVRTDSFNTASGNYSFAVGTDNNASGVVAMTLGSGNTASGDRAVALGRENIASGSRSFASGFLNISSHNQTFTHGYLNTASQQYAVAVGRENTSAGIGSIALGYLNYLATGSYSFAAGYDNTIVPSYGGAIGYNNTILSTYGMAFGASNQAGNYAIAAGGNNDATAIYSVALGASNLASAQSSIALGQTNTSSGIASIAIGYLVTASADHSIAIGRQSSANALYSSAVGGRLNNADAIYSGIFAGFNNNVPAAGYSGSVIIGGDSNVNSGSYSAIVGGRNNTIGPAVNSVIIGGTNINAADTSNTVFVPNFYATGSVQAPNISNATTGEVVYYNTSSGAFTYGAKPGANGNAQVDDFYYSISNSVDTRPVFQDSNVTINWDETANDLEFQMDVAPGGSGDMRSLAYLVGGATQNTAITTTGFAYDIYAAGITAGNRMEAFITAENDATYPAYHITVYNTGESFENTIWIRRITKF